MRLFDRLVKPMCLVKADKISRCCERFVKGRTLDFGAGRCYIARELKERYNADITCLDIDNKLNETKMKLVVYDGKIIPFRSNIFDTVLIVYVLHHCTDPIESLKECIRVCRNGGRIIIFEDVGMTIQTYFMDWIANKLHNVKAPLNFKKRKDWLSLFNNLGLEVEHVEDGVERQIFYPFVGHSMFVLKVKK
jgi:ubiquinone/menaquinone biosynthesis C-methylase UbiE